MKHSWLAAAVAIALAGMTACSPTTPVWEGTEALKSETSSGHYVFEPYHLDAMHRANSALTEGPALEARPLSDKGVEMARDEFLFLMGQGIWLHGGDLTDLSEPEMLGRWRAAFEGTSLDVAQEVGALVRQRQRAWQDIHGTDAAAPRNDLPLTNENARKETMASLAPDPDAAPLEIVSPDVTVQRLAAARTKGFDTHTAHVPPAITDLYVETAMGRAQGIGLTFQVQQGRLVVVALEENAPAKESGKIEVGDVLVRVRAPNQEWKRLGDVIGALAFFRQETEGFDIQLERNGNPFEVSLVPSEYPNDAEHLRSFEETIPLPDGSSIQALRLELGFFYENGRTNQPASKDLADALSKAKASDIQLVILDLRRARGGGIPEALAVGGLFVDQGPLGYVRGLDPKPQMLQSPSRNAQWNGALQVWVGPQTASSAELVAQGVGDRARDVQVVGWPTYGKGTLQRRMELDMASARQLKPSRLGEIWVTMGELYGPTGRSLQQRGVALDWALPNPVAEPWGERGQTRALVTGPDLPNSEAAPQAQAAGVETLFPALPDDQALPALRAAAGQAWAATRAPR